MRPSKKCPTHKAVTGFTRDDGCKNGLGAKPITTPRTLNPRQWDEIGQPTRDDGGEDGSAADAVAVPEHEAAAAKLRATGHSCAKVVKF